MSVKIDGLSELSEMLTQESVRTAKRYLVNCAKPAAEVVIEAMKETEGEHELTRHTHDRSSSAAGSH